MFLHADTLRPASWQLQLRGRKKWHLCDGTAGPAAAAATYCAVRLLTPLHTFNHHLLLRHRHHLLLLRTPPHSPPRLWQAAAVDAFDPDYGRCASFRGASCLETTVGPGEASASS